MKGWHAMATQQLKVFVSHSHEDNAFCQSLVTALRGAGADVWYDEHNLESGQLLDVIQRELGRRKIFVLILSKHAFGSKWVRRETSWAYGLADDDPTRVILPVTAGPIEPGDCSPEHGWLFLRDFKRIEAPGYRPFSQAEAIGRVLHAIALTPAGEAPAPVAPQPSESVDELITRGIALSEQGKDTEALALLERATQLNPSSHSAWFNTGYSLAARGRYEQAVAAFERAIKLNRNDGAAWNNKGRILWNLERYSEALAAYEQALALDPNFAAAWNGKAISLRTLWRTAEAEEAEQRAKELGG